MDCIQARLLLMFTRPGATEIAPPELELLQGHLDRCGVCRALAQREKHDDAMLTLAMREVPVPSGLQNRILERLSRQPRPWPWTWIAAAAVVVLALGLSTGWYLKPAPQLSSDDFLTATDSQNVADWFHRKGLNVQVPSDFDAKYLESAAIVSLHGRLVPKLLYVNASSQAVAHVYFVSGRDFSNISDFTLDGSSHEPSVQECPEAPGHFFLFIYTSGSRENFVKCDKVTG